MKYLFGFLALLLSCSLFAATPKIDGLWEVRYDASNTPSAYIRITTLPNGELQGLIENAFPRPGQTPYTTCNKCTGANKDKPIEGLKVLWGMKPNGANQWKGGQILNAETGKVYSANITLAENGQSLSLRGFVVSSMFGDTSTWKRIQ